MYDCVEEEEGKGPIPNFSMGRKSREMVEVTLELELYFQGLFVESFQNILGRSGR